MLLPGTAQVSAGRGQFGGSGRPLDEGPGCGRGRNGQVLHSRRVLRDEQGAWTVPHLHRGFEESFFILDGTFIFTLGEVTIEATPGMYILVPRGTPHTISAAEGGGRFLTLMVPGGLEEMFFELGGMAPEALRDPAARAAISGRYDSIPVNS